MAISEQLQKLFPFSQCKLFLQQSSAGRNQTNMTESQTLVQFEFIVVIVCSLHVLSHLDLVQYNQ